MGRVGDHNMSRSTFGNILYTMLRYLKNFIEDVTSVTEM